MAHRASRNRPGTVSKKTPCHQPQDITDEIRSAATKVLSGMQLPTEFLNVALANLHYTKTFPEPGEQKDFEDEVVILRVNEEFPLLGVILLVGESLHAVMETFLPAASKNKCWHLMRFMESLKETIWSVAEFACFKHPGYSPCGLRCQDGRLVLTAKAISESEQLAREAFSRLAALVGNAERKAMTKVPGISAKDLDIGAFVPFKMGEQGPQ